MHITEEHKQMLLQECFGLSVGGLTGWAISGFQNTLEACNLIFILGQCGLVATLIIQFLFNKEVI